MGSYNAVAVAAAAAVDSEQRAKQANDSRMNIININNNNNNNNNDHFNDQDDRDDGREGAEKVWVEGALIVGAGPAGMAVAACLQHRGVPCRILERADCVASLWKHRTYDRLHLHLSKSNCALPLLPIPASCPSFLARRQFIDYLESYARRFSIRPLFGRSVRSAYFHPASSTWRIRATATSSSLNGGCDREVEYVSRWLVVASGENAETVMPSFPGMAGFRGDVTHSAHYKNGAFYHGKKVLVVGSGNSGMEIALDLFNSGAHPSLVVRSPLHILPREMFGISTFSVAGFLLRLLPVSTVDRILVLYSWLRLGDNSARGLKRPKVGPLELKSKMGKTPVLDVGTLSLIKTGQIQVRAGVDCLTQTGVRFLDGSTDSFDAVILATGYRSDVPTWLHDESSLFAANGLPAKPSPGNWKGREGLYAAGLGGMGLLGASKDAQNIAEDIIQAYYSCQHHHHLDRKKPANSG